MSIKRIFLPSKSDVKDPATGLALQEIERQTWNDVDTLAQGAWTPALKFGGAAVGMAGSQKGVYVRVSNAVLATGTVTLTAKGSSTGRATITGLPYPAGNTYGIACCLASAGMSGLLSMVAQASTDGNIYLENQVSTGQVDLLDTNFTNTASFSFSLIYSTING